MVNPFAEPLSVTVKLAGTGKLGNKAWIITLPNPDPEAENPLDQPGVVAPQQGVFTDIAPVFTCALAPYALATLRIPQKPPAE
jgi:hypothetical protein